jgi:hypothetical protein
MFECVIGEVLNEFQLFLSLSSRVQGVHIVHKECVDRGELTSGKAQEGYR